VSGIVYHLSPPAVGGTTWTETVIWSFPGYTGDGSFPSGGLIMDGAGNLYGNTQNGGDSSAGAIFQLSPPQGVDGEPHPRLRYQ
jgi:uncharacterized repeat protein (TIGR03803 family)